MRALPEPVLEAVRLANELASARKWPWKRAETTRRIEGALDLIAASREWLALPRIISLALHDRTEVAGAAARAITHLHGIVPVRELPRLDRSFRELSPWLHPEVSRWHQMAASDVPHLDGKPAGRSLIQLATFHANGRVREAALEHARLSERGSELPYYLLRLNDWVAPVRRAAAVAVRAHLRPERAADVVAALPIIDATKRWGRIEAPEILREIEALLRSPEASPALRAGLTADDAFERRSCFRRALGSSSLANPEVLAAALDDNDSWIRVWACQHLCECPSDGFDQLADALLRDPLGTVRARALEKALERNLVIDAEPLLCDSNASVRGLAQAQMLVEDRDIVERYRALLAQETGKRLAAAIVGLAEAGNVEDAARIRPFLENETPRVRRAALHALATLRADDIGTLCLRALHDPQPSVTHASRDLLKARAAHVTGHDLWDTFVRAPTEQGKVDALSVIATTDRWDQLRYLLRATADSAEAVREEALFNLSRWLARAVRCFTSPSSEQLEATENELTAAPLSERVRREVEQILSLHRRQRPQG